MARSPAGLNLNQKKYTLDLLKESEKLRCRPMRTPIEANHKLSIKDGKPLSDEGKGMY